jgi:hypothetical protein
MRRTGLGARRLGVALLAAATAGWALAIPSAADIQEGAGNIFGTVNINAPGIQPALSLACNGVSWSYQTSGPQAGVFATTGEAFAGTVAFGASGGTSSTCETIDVGVGTLSVSLVTGGNLDPAVFHASLNCSSMGGSYNRLGTIVIVAVPTGSCSVDGVPQTVSVAAAGQLTPTATGGNGITTAITQASFLGAWSIVNPNN